MRWCSAICFLMILFACQKESIQLELTELSSSTDEAIHDLFFVNENLAYYCGGELWKSGVVGKSTDGGNTWEVVLEADNILYGVRFKNELEGVAFGYSGRVWRTKDGGANWSLKENDPLYPVFNDATFIDDNKLIMAAGVNYYIGAFASYFFEGQSFGDSSIDQSMQTVHFFDNQEGLMAGYGALFTTSDAGQHWEPNMLRGDFFRDLDFNDSGQGLIIGYQGKVFESTDKGITWDKNTRKASFFNTKGNLESVSIYESSAFIAGQNASLWYSDNFLSGEYVQVETPFQQDFLKVYLSGSTSGFVSGSDGLLFKFNY